MNKLSILYHYKMTEIQNIATDIYTEKVEVRETCKGRYLLEKKQSVDSFLFNTGLNLTFLSTE